VKTKLTVSEQFEELEIAYREEFRLSSWSYLCFRDLLRNYSRWSPKMRCWLFRSIFDELYQCTGGLVVARNLEGDKPKAPQTESWGFVNIQLSDDERDAATVKYQDAALMWETLITVVKDGYKLTLSYDGETDAFCAAFSGTNCGKPNERFTLTAWGSHETEALEYLVYKHVDKLEFVWNKPGVKQARIG